MGNREVVIGNNLTCLIKRLRGNTQQSPWESVDAGCLDFSLMMVPISLLFLGVSFTKQF